MDSKDSACNLLEDMLIDENKEPTDLPLSLLKSITNNFSDDLQIGSGGFAVVYKGLLQNGTVAVKKLTKTLDMHETKFKQEVDCLMRVKHKNIVRFLGYCADTQGKMWKFMGKNVIAEEQTRVLCFQYLPQGSLDKYISDASEGLVWIIRYQIIKGICKGLHYLHQQKIVHSDLKSANILLDNYMLPKITDFGLSKCFDEEQTRAMTSNPFGTLGYMAPELRDGLITFKSDIYSLGIIIIELLTGNKGCPDIEKVLESWSIKLKTSPGDTQLEPIRVCAEIGIECIDYNPAKRPDARRILERLDEMENIYGVNKVDISTSSETIASSSFSEMVYEVQPLFVPEAPSPLQGITSMVPMGMGVTSTQMLDVHPLELCFPSELNQDVIISPVTLTNWTLHHVGVWITPSCPEKWADFCHPDVSETDHSSSFFKMMEPRSTVAIRMTRSHEPCSENSPPRETGTFEVLMVVMGSKKDYVESLKQSIGSRLNMHIDLLKRIEALGGEVHRAMLKATICDAASCETHNFIPALPSDFGKLIDGMDVHPTEPWVLVKASNVQNPMKSSVFILNYLTQEILTSLPPFISEEIYMAKFIPQEKWFATGDSEGYVTVYANSTKVIKKFSAHGGDPVGAFAVHPTNPFLLTSSERDTWIRLWDWDQGWKCTQIFHQCEFVASCIIWNPLDTNTFACVSETNIKVWEVGISKEGSHDYLSNNEILSWDPTTTLEAKSIACCFGGDSHRNFMITCPEYFSSETCARIWDIGTKESVHKLFVSSHMDTNGAAWHPTLPILATSHSESRTVCLWDAKAYRLVKIIPLTAQPREQSMVFIGTKDLPRLIVGSEKGVVILEINLPTFLKTDLGDGGGN